MNERTKQLTVADPSTATTSSYTQKLAARDKDENVGKLAPLDKNLFLTSFALMEPFLWGPETLDRQYQQAKIFYWPLVSSRHLL
jgi:hypothetical protein